MKHLGKIKNPKMIKIFLLFILYSLVSTLTVSSNTYTDRQKYETETYNDAIIISAVGDTMLGSTYPVEVLPKEQERLYNLPFLKFLSDSDIVFGNLEGPLVNRGESRKGRNLNKRTYAFRMPTFLADDLQKAGFNALSIANNHSLDFGTTGIESTISELKKRNIQPVGGKHVATFQIKGKKICILGFYVKQSEYSHSILDIEVAKRVVKYYKENYDIVIVSFHGGAEGPKAQRTPNREERFFGENRGNVIKFAHSVIDAGADLVLGHGPHVLRAVEVYKGKFIAYSLGNFYTYELFSTNYPNNITAILKIWISTKDGNFLQASILPLKQNQKGIPQIDKEETATHIIQKLSLEDLSYKVNFLQENISLIK